MVKQNVHFCAAIIVCIARNCFSFENQTVNNNVTKSESNDLKSILNLTGNVTKSLESAEDHTQRRNSSEDGELMNKESRGAKPGEFMINLKAKRIIFWTIIFYGQHILLLTFYNEEHKIAQYCLNDTYS